MEKVAGQQTYPLWERSSSERGHRSSVDKAIDAHRARTQARTDRIQARRMASAEINNSFFPKPTISAPGVSPMNQSEVTNQLDNLPLNIPLQESVVDQSRGFDGIPLQVEDIYNQFSMEPIRGHAEEVLEKEAADATQEFQSDEVPKGSYVDYHV